MLVLVWFLFMVRTVVLRVFVIRLVPVFVAVTVFMRMTVLDVSMPVFVGMGMSVFVFVLHRYASLHFRSIQQLRNETSPPPGSGGAPRR